jgi:hypothetical protein
VNDNDILLPTSFPVFVNGSIFDTLDEEIKNFSFTGFFIDHLAGKFQKIQDHFPSF